ncbi:MAG: PEP/pyruvate-binding domain-containing protein [Candidatus Paceibacterota bacterium]
MKYTENLSKLNKDSVTVAGGKGASLGEMMRVGILVPPGFVVLSVTFQKLLEEGAMCTDIKSILDSVDHQNIDALEDASKKIQTSILNIKIPEEVSYQIKKSFNELGAQCVAVRSSATNEDSTSATWAGQLGSYLNTTEKDLLENIKKCWVSLFTPRAIFYGFQNNIAPQETSVSVVIQKMVKSEKSGVAFSVHPVTKEYNTLIIEAGLGLGEQVVSGHITPDSYTVDKKHQKITSRNIKTRTQVLSDVEILELSRLVIIIEKHFGFPCDIEWAFEQGKLYILQSRPITTLVTESSKRSSEDKIIIKDIMTLIARRNTDSFDASLRIESWSNGLKNELGLGYKTIVINSDGEYFVDAESERKISEALSLKGVNEALSYIKKIYALKDALLIQVRQEEYATVVNDFSKLFTYFLLARRISENVYKKSSSKEKHLIEKWRSDERLFEPLDVYKKRVPQDNPTGEWSIIFNNNDIRYVGKKITWTENETEEEDTAILKGETGYPGFVRGRVRVILSQDQMSTFKEGDILVTTMATPEYTPILGKARAFITDEGGVTSHAAIISRELKKPCIIGTKNATKRLLDGDEVEVDATDGVVRIVR